MVCFDVLDKSNYLLWYMDGEEQMCLCFVIRDLKKIRYSSKSTPTVADTHSTLS